MFMKKGQLLFCRLLLPFFQQFYLPGGNSNAHSDNTQSENKLTDLSKSRFVKAYQGIFENHPVSDFININCSGYYFVIVQNKLLVNPEN